jgi:DNA cross-link repair 1A protein
MLNVSRAKMKKWLVDLLMSALELMLRFEKWNAEKAKRKEKGLPAIVDYRDETYVSRCHLVTVLD